ncbi:MAG: NUDIX hydrolase [Kiritimatiellaeota bacterium]|nr:NUDIX hydrolase [Kiritimatiellota bacterium]
MTHEIVGRERLGEGKWIYIEKLRYIDRAGVARDWESAGRISGQSAVIIAAVMKNSRELLLVRQFRPPLGRYVVEFPAGLIDDGESPETTAVRELREETGYLGEVLECTPRSASSPGMSGETLVFVRMTVDENASSNLRPETDFDESEDIETFKVPLEDLSVFLAGGSEAGDSIDAKLAAFALGLSLSSKR